MILKNKIKIYISALTILLLFSLGIRSINADELMELKFNKNNIELAVGSSYQLKAIDREHAGSKIQWKSDNTDIVIVTPNGKLKAKKPGRAIITAKCQGQIKKCIVDVKIITIKKLEGSWEIDTDMTMKVNKTTMRTIYGSAFYQYGSEMEFKRNGKFNYYVGAGNGGDGTFRVKRNYIKYEISRYEDNCVEREIIKIKRFGSKKTRLLTKYGGYIIYWKKR